MEKSTDRETQDIMNVESFSQLPFTRPKTAAIGGGGGAIRLFGKEFSNNTDEYYHSSDYSNNNANKEVNGDNNNNNSNMTTEVSSRKFECHYCCRNFPTSQALGGHQNAHKRERQQAKRAHLQSAMMHGAAGFPDVYGLISYGTRLGSGSAAAALPMAYHSPYGGGSRLYGSHGGSKPITGNPLALWRIPAAATGGSAHGSAGYVRERLGAMHQQMAPVEMKQQLTSIGGAGNIASHHELIRFGYEAKTEMHDHVSLDLHL